MADKTDLEKKIIEWLNNQGYPLEMAVAQLFRNYGFWAVQSDFYEDKESGKRREVDVVANLSKTSKIVSPLSFGFSIGCCVECKLGKDKPWLLLTSKDLPQYDIRDLAVTTDDGFKVLTEALSVSEFKNLGLMENIHYGYGLTQAFTSGQDIPYQAVMEATKSTFSKMKEFEEMIDASWGLDIPIFFPVVVFDGKLFETQLDDKEELILREIELGIVGWRALSAEKSVFISTRSGLAKLIQQIRHFADALISIDQEFTDIVYAFFKKEGYA